MPFDLLVMVDSCPKDSEAKYYSYQSFGKILNQVNPVIKPNKLTSILAKRGLC